MAVIEIRNLTKIFDTVRAVDNLNLEVEEGEFFCFLAL